MKSAGKISNDGKTGRGHFTDTIWQTWVKQDYLQAASYYRSAIAKRSDDMRLKRSPGSSAELNLLKMLLSKRVAPQDGELVSDMLGDAWNALPYFFGKGPSVLDDERFEIAASKLSDAEYSDDGAIDALSYLDDNPRLEEVFFLDSRERRDADYLYKAGCTFACGEGVPRDDHKAFEFFRLAAKLEHGESQWMLAQLYDQLIFSDGVHFSGFYYGSIRPFHSYLWMKKAKENNVTLGDRSIGPHGVWWTAEE